MAVGKLAGDDKGDITMGKICAIILAAGESKRMGFPKMLLDFRGMPMLERVIENIRISLVDEIIIVVGAYREQITELAVRTGVKYCYNEHYKSGMLSSVQCGFGFLPENTDAALVFQGDQPLVTQLVVNEVIKSFRSSSKGIVIPVYNKKRGHPLLVSAKYFAEITRLDPSVGLRALAEKFHEDVEEVGVKEAGILRDFDTFEEYKREINQI